MKNCIKCGFSLDDNAKFCSECSAKQPIDQPKNVGIGDKNVISGDIIGQKEEVHAQTYIVHNYQNDKAAPQGECVLKIWPDLSCKVHVDGEYNCDAEEGKVTRLSLRRGTYLLEFNNIENSEDVYSCEHKLSEPEELLKVPLKEKRQERERTEKERLERERLEKERIAYLEKAELIIFGDGDKKGFRDKETGEMVIQAKYDNAESFNEGLARVKLNGKCGFIDKTGKEVTPLKYDDAWSFNEGWAIIKLNGKYGYIDKTGQEVIPLKYDDAWGFEEGGLARVKLNGKCGFIDKTEKEIIPLKYDYSTVFCEGLAVVLMNGKWGYIDKTGKEVIPFKYDEAWPFSYGLSRVKLNGKCGFIDKTGKEVIPLKYEDADHFYDGRVMVKLNNEFFYIDKSGNRLK